MTCSAAVLMALISPPRPVAVEERESRLEDEDDGDEEDDCRRDDEVIEGDDEGNCSVVERDSGFMN